METRTYEVETSLTLDYRKSAWGLERIVLDTISNHLPADSNGTKTSVKLKQDGQYLDLKEADPSKPTEEVMFEDDGSGYDAGLLSILFSPKAADALSVGQFGEGLKLVATAALRNGINVEYRSRNWFATPFARHETVGRHEIDRLCFRITENGDQLAGSRTVFSNPSPELMGEIFQLPSKVLALNDSYIELYSEKWSSGYNSRIIDLGTETRSLFIKGVRVQHPIRAIFSYDLGLENITPDRIFADRDSVLNRIGSLLTSTANPKVIGTVLQVAHQEPDGDYYEFSAFRAMLRESRGSGLHEEGIPKITSLGIISYFDKGISARYEKEKFLSGIDFEKFLQIYLPSTGLTIQNKAWINQFLSVFGENAVIASTDINANKDAEIMGFKPVRLNAAVADYLSSNGIKTADQITKETEYRWVSIDDLTDGEKSMLAMVDEINGIVLDQKMPVDVRVYSGLYTKAGREIESSDGVQMANPDRSKYIGIKRARLQDFTDFAQTYIHELGHLVTGASDYDRRHTDFAYNALAKIVGAQLGKTKTS